MFSGKPTTPSTERFSAQTARLRRALETADAVVVGAGAGLSAAAGLAYDGERFERLFADFREAYGFTDMYTGGFYPYETPGGILGVVVAAHPCQPLRRRGGGAVSGPAAAARDKTISY